MRFVKSLNKRENKFDEIYKLTGIRLTDEPVVPLPPEIQDESDEVYHLLHNEPAKVIPRLKRLIAGYPDVPSFKNHLFNAYMVTGQVAKADALLKRIREEHPDYVFGIVNLIMGTEDAEELKKMKDLLGNPREITSIVEREVYHISEYTFYTQAAGHLEALIGETEKAKERLSILMKLDVDKELLERLAREIILGRVIHYRREMEEQNERIIKVDSHPTAKRDYTEAIPVLHHPELIELFYTRAINLFNREDIDKVLALPRESLIEDLEAIIDDAILRKPYFETLDFDNNSHEFFLHALYFLGALRSEKSLEKVLDLIRQEEGFSDYWLGDVSFELLFPVLYHLGENQVEVLKNYLLEPHNFGQNRAIVSMVLSQIVMHQPNRREEVVDCFRQVFEHHLAHPEDAGIIDTEFFSFSIADIANFAGKELLPLVEEMYNRGWITDQMMGNLDAIKKEYHMPLHDSNKRPLPENIYEYYSREYHNRRAAPGPESSELFQFFPERSGRTTAPATSAKTDHRRQRRPSK